VIVSAGIRRAEQVMGTVFSITVLDPIDPAVVDDVVAWLHHVDDTFSTFRPDSVISRIGRGEVDPLDAPSEVRHVLAWCEDFEVASEGRFSIRPGRPGGPGLDPAGYVKGWSVDEAALLLIDAGASNFVINGGGDVLCVGAPPEGGRWRVGIRHPDDPWSAGAVLAVTGGAVATSGTYERGDHIRTTGPGAAMVASVTVAGPRLGTADALATAIFADGATTLGWVSRFPGYEVLLITTDGRVRWTEGLDEAVRYGRG
jgi:thiamine biosynthesis lipoprotein